MKITKEQKQTLTKKHGKNEKDTGNAAVQIAILTNEISNLTEHLKQAKKDKHSRTGIYKKSSQRNKLLSYLKKNDITSYTKLIKELKIRDTH